IPFLFSTSCVSRSEITSMTLPATSGPNDMISLSMYRFIFAVVVFAIPSYIGMVLVKLGCGYRRMMRNTCHRCGYEWRYCLIQCSECGQIKPPNSEGPRL